MLETERLIIRKWKDSDLEDLYEYSKDELVGPSAGWKVHENIEETKRVLDDFIKDENVFAIELKSEMKVIGGIGLHKISAKGSLFLREKNIGYVLNPRYWGCGIAPEAVDKILEYGFLNLDIDIFWCGHFDFNERSKRVIEKSGFRYKFSQEEVIKQLGDMKVLTHYYMISKYEYINMQLK